MSVWARHQVFEKNSIILVVGILLVIAIGGLVEITPLFYLKSTIEVVDGTSITQLLEQRLPHGKPADYLIRVNRQPVAADHVLGEGDRVSVTPTKIEGARG